MFVVAVGGSGQESGGGGGIAVEAKAVTSILTESVRASHERSSSAHLQEVVNPLHQMFIRRIVSDLGLPTPPRSLKHEDACRAAHPRA